MSDKKRPRYIAFRIKNGKTDRRGMINAIKSTFTGEEYDSIEPWLTVFTGTKGIVRCNHTGKEEAIDILNDMDVGGGRVRTVITSGTIKKAKAVLFDHG